MVQVKLARDWTDAEGARHSAGEIVDVDEVALAELEELGAVDGPVVMEGFVGPTFGPPEEDPEWES